MNPILVVDDEALIVEEVVDALELEGFSCLSAQDVDGALNILSSGHRVDLVITDLKMPGRSGWDLIDIVGQRDDDNVSFLVVSGHATHDLEPEVLPPSVVGFMRKPMDVDALLREVQKFAATH